MSKQYSKKALSSRAKAQPFAKARNPVLIALFSLLLAATVLLPTKVFAYDTFWGYYVCYDQNTRGAVGSCVISNQICNAKYLHYYGQYNDRYEQKDGLLRCHYDRKSVVDPVARTWLH
ncbi:MAG: hypothetical protein P1U63_09830 [Coxiellaceae bacterium]|nr:hypothetical protein [Coxiellaceae bacterium]